MRDNNLNFREVSEGSLDATDTSAGLQTDGQRGLCAVVTLPVVFTGNWTLVISYEYSFDGSAWALGVSEKVINAAWSAANALPHKIITPIDSRWPYVRQVLTVAGTTPVLGAVHSHLTCGLLAQKVGVGFPDVTAEQPLATV